METYDNVLYIKCFLNLGYRGFKTIKSTSTFKMFLEIGCMKEELIIFTSGKESLEVINIIL